MSKFFKKFKRSMAIALSVTTFAWALGPVALLLPTQALAATAQAGDLIKMEGLSSVYYLGADSKRYVFPNETAFKSWYSDFSSVKTVSQSELESYSLGSNVTIRPGTKLVKITTDPKVYAVETGGTLKWVPDEATAITLYGTNWATRVVDVPDAFFTNYTVSTEQVSATAYPEGTLIKYTGSSDIYLVASATEARKFASMEAFTANRYKESDIVVAPATITYTAGTEVTAAESALVDLSSTGVTPGDGGTVVGSGLTVSLSSSTAGAASIIADETDGEYPQALIPFTTVNFTAGSDGDVKVTSVKFTRTGIASDADLGNLYLYDGNTKLAEYNSFSDKVATFNSVAGLFTVSAGTTKEITLKGDLAKSSTNVSSGKTIGFNVAASTSITTDGATVSGTFPIAGNQMSTAVVDDLGHLSFGTVSYASTVKADESNKELFRVPVTADAQKMQIQYLKFTLVGTVDATDVSNIRLEVSGTQVGEAKELSSDKTIVYDFGANPIEVLSGATKQIALRADMTGGASRNLKFTIQKSADVVLYDTAYGIFVTPNKTNTTTAFGIVEPAASTTISSGSITTGVATDSPTGNIPDGATGITMAKFNFSATGEAVKVESLSITCSGSDTSDLLANVKLLVEGSQVGTTDTSLLCDAGTLANGTSAYTFGNTFVIPAGTTKALTVVADTTDTTVASGATFAISLVVGSSNAVGQDTLTSLSTSAQTARTLTAQAGTAGVVENTAFGDKSSTNPTGTANASDVQIASFIITAGSGEAIDVTQIAVKDDTTTTLGGNFQNLKLKHEGVAIGTTVGTLNTTASNYTFTPSSAIRIAAGAQYIVDVFADIKSSVADSNTTLSPVLAFDSVTATGATTSADMSYPTDVNLQNAYVVANGNLTVTTDGDTPVATQLVMGATDQELAKFKLTSDAAEDILISDITIGDSVSSAATGTLKNLKLYLDGALVSTGVNLDGTSTTTYAVANFTGLNITIPKNSNKILTVKGDANLYDNGATTGSTHTLALLVNKGSGVESITAKGGSSGASITGASLDYFATGASTDSDQTASEMTAYRTKLTVSWASDTPSGSSTGMAGATVAKIQVSNSANAGSYAATVKYINLAISRTGLSNTADRELKIYKDSITSGNLLVTTSWLAAGNQNFGNTAITNGSTASTFPSTEIAAGSTKTFIVTLDTTDAASTNSLAIFVDSDDVAWRDGAITSEITSVNSLPLIAKTFTY